MVVDTTAQAFKDSANLNESVLAKAYFAAALESLLVGASTPSIEKVGSTPLAPNYDARHITTLTTVTPTAVTAYISVLVVTTTAAGTACVITVKDKGATPKTLYTATLAVGTVVLNFNRPIIMSGGIDIVLSGTTAGTVDVFDTYWQ